MADIGDGASFTMTGFTGDIVSMNWTGVNRASIDITHLGTTTGKVFMPGDRFDGGELEITMHHDPNEQPPYNAAEATGTVTYPVPSGGIGGATAAATMFVTNWDPGNIAIDEVMVSTVTLKVDGDITFVDST